MEGKEGREMRKVERAILIALVGGAMVFMCGLAIVGLGIRSSEMTPRPATSTPRPTPSPSPTIDTHLHDEMCADMRALEVERQAIRETILAEEDFIIRSEQIIKQRILLGEDRKKAQWLIGEVDDFIGYMIDDCKFGFFLDGSPTYKNLPKEVKEWAVEVGNLYGFMRDELNYFTMVGEDREWWERMLRRTGEETLVPLSEYKQRTIFQNRIYERLMERYCQ